MIKPVVSYPNAILRNETFQVSDFASTDFQAFCSDLCDTMDAATGAGIAAPQLGVPARVFVINKVLTKAPKHLIVVNPEIVSLSDEKQTNKEGCLSFYGVFLPVTRPRSCVLNYLDEEGNQRTLAAEDYLAQAILHEYDHLEGKLLIDQAKTVRRELINKKFRGMVGKYYDYRLPTESQAR